MRLRPLGHLSKQLLCVHGGEGGIRTLGDLAATTVFETAPIDHSGTSPIFCFSLRANEQKTLLVNRPLRALTRPLQLRSDG